MGEHVREGVFRVVDVSVQRSGGSHTQFLRDPANHDAQLRSFFARTGQDFTRFNYLGEWHSHPTFEPLPSAVDIATMQSLVEDPKVGANFLILLIATLTAGRRIDVSAIAFSPNALPVSVAIDYEHENSEVRGVRRLLRYLSEWSRSTKS